MSPVVVFSCAIMAAAAVKLGAKVLVSGAQLEDFHTLMLMWGWVEFFGWLRRRGIV